MVILYKTTQAHARFCYNVSTIFYFLSRMWNTGLLAKALVEVKKADARSGQGLLTPNYAERFLLVKAGATAVVLGIFDEALYDSRFYICSLR